MFWMETKTNKLDTTGFDGAGAVFDDFVGVQNGHEQHIFFLLGLLSINAIYFE